METLTFSSDGSPHGVFNSFRSEGRVSKGVVDNPFELMGVKERTNRQRKVGSAGCSAEKFGNTAQLFLGECGVWTWDLCAPPRSLTWCVQSWRYKALDARLLKSVFFCDH